MFKNIILFLILLIVISCKSRKLTYISECEKWVDCKFSNLSNKELTKFSQAMNNLGAKISVQEHGLKTWQMKRFGHGHGIVILEVYPGYDNPDYSYGVIHKFTEDWKYEGPVVFSGGYRMFITEISLEEVADKIIMKVVRNCAGPYIIVDNKELPLAVDAERQVQFWDITNKEIFIQRTEDDQGNIISDSDGWESK
jgi:hypothetical protein